MKHLNEFVIADLAVIHIGSYSKKEYDFAMAIMHMLEETVQATSIDAAAPVIPNGYLLVPIEPTDEMLAAAEEGDREYTMRNFGDSMTVTQGAEDHWAAMIRSVQSTGDSCRLYQPSTGLTHVATVARSPMTVSVGWLMEVPANTKLYANTES